MPGSHLSNWYIFTYAYITRWATNSICIDVAASQAYIINSISNMMPIWRQQQAQEFRYRSTDLHTDMHVFYISASLLIFSAEANLLCFFLLAFNALYMFFALVCASLHCVVAHVLCFDYSFLLFGILMPAFLCLVLRRSLCVLPALIQRLQQRSFCFHISWHIPVLFSVHICTYMYFSFLSFKLLMPLVMLVASALLISVVWHYTDLLLSVICFAFGFAWYVYSFN